MLLVAVYGVEFRLLNKVEHPLANSSFNGLDSDHEHPLANPSVKERSEVGRLGKVSLNVSSVRDEGNREEGTGQRPE